MTEVENWSDGLELILLMALRMKNSEVCDDI